MTGELMITQTLRKMLISRVEIDEEDARRLRTVHEDGAVLYVFRLYGEAEYTMLDEVLDQLHLPRPAAHVPPSVLAEPAQWFSSAVIPSDPPAPGHLTEALKAGKPAVLSLFRRTPLLPHRPASRQTLISLVRTLRNHPAPVTVVPVIPVWGKPLVRSPLPLESLLGHDDAPGTLRKLGALISGGLKPRMVVGESFRLDTAVTSGEPPEKTADAVAARILADMDTRWRAVMGPKITPRRKVQDRLMRSPVVRRAAEEEVARGQDPKEVRSELLSIIDEIPADPSLGTVASFKKALEVLWKLIYSGFEVDRDGMRRLARLQQEAPLLIVPAHRSHVDYLVLSWLMDRFGISLPYVAAGRNLSFWPLGPLFRGGGAFFIRRTMKGDRLYRTVLKEYMAQILEDGINVEFFIEGGRSRTGKVLYPKTGLLAIVCELVAEGRIPSPVVAPISIGYEKVIEERSYMVEGEGQPKEDENLGQLVRASRVLLDEYGRLNIQVARDFRLSEVLEGTRPGTEQFRRAVERAGLMIIREIALSTLVTPSMVAAAALLEPAEAIVDRSHFRENARNILNLLKNSKTRISWSLHLHPEDAVEEALGRLSGVEIAGDRIYLAPQHRLALAYYKNGLLSPLGWASLGAVALEAGGDPVTALYLWQIMSRELPHLTLDRPESILEAGRNLSADQQRVFASMLADILEGQAVALEESAAVLDGRESMSFSHLVSAIRKRADARVRRAEIRRPEGMSVYVIRETIQWAADQEILEHRRERGTDEVLRGPGFDRLSDEIQSRRQILARLR